VVFFFFLAELDDQPMRDVTSRQPQQLMTSLSAPVTSSLTSSNGE